MLPQQDFSPNSPLKSKSITRNLQPKDIRSRNNQHISQYDNLYHPTENRLPVNLFHSSAQYNKMLITNGKSLKKKSEPQLQGFIQNLEFINDPIFKSCEQKRQSFKQNSQTIDRKQVNSFTQQCQCCCCDQYCHLCANDNKCKKSNAIQQEDITKQEILKIKKELKKNIKNKTKSKNKIITSKKQMLGISQKIYPKQYKNDIQCSSSYLSHKSFNIDNLICNSLICFQQNKRQSKLKRMMEKQKTEQMKNKLRQLQDNIRNNNRQKIKNGGKSANKNRPASKAEVRMSYWNSMRSHITEQLKKNNSVMKRPVSSGKSQGNLCNHKPKLTQQTIMALKIKHEQEALAQLARKQFEKCERERVKLKKLQKLEKTRRQNIKNCPMKKFEPTQAMLENAFVNL